MTNILTKQAARLPEKKEENVTSVAETPDEFIVRNSQCISFNEAIDLCTAALPNVNKVLIEKIKEYVRSNYKTVVVKREIYSVTEDHVPKDDLLTYLETLTKDDV